MYSKDKSVRLNVRLSTEQYARLEKLADTCGVNISSAFRIVIDSYFKSGQVAFVVLDGEKNEN